MISARFYPLSGDFRAEFTAVPRTRADRCPGVLRPWPADDGLMVHTGDGKGKSTAAFGMALRGRSQGFDIGVFHFVKSAKWRVGEQTVLERLGALHDQTGEGGSVQWHKMGSGWSWSRKAGAAEDHAGDGPAGWNEIKRRLVEQTHDLYVLDEFTYPINWGWVDVAESPSQPSRSYRAWLSDATNCPYPKRRLLLSALPSIDVRCGAAGCPSHRPRRQIPRPDSSSTRPPG